MGCMAMKDILKKVSKLVGGFDLMDIGNGLFMTKFDMEEGRNQLIGRGAWMIFDRYL